MKSKDGKYHLLLPDLFKSVWKKSVVQFVTNIKKQKVDAKKNQCRVTKIIKNIFFFIFGSTTKTFIFYSANQIVPKRRKVQIVISAWPGLYKYGMDHFVGKSQTFSPEVTVL
jgi:hypothetical protein